MLCVMFAKFKFGVAFGTSNALSLGWGTRERKEDHFVLITKKKEHNKIS